MSQASDAPASSNAASTSGQSRGSRSSTLVSSSTAVASRPAVLCRRLADQQPQHVGVPLGITTAGADPHRVDRHGRLRSPAVGQRGEQGRPGRRAQLDVDRPPGARHTTEKLDHRRRRNRQAAVLGGHRATPHRHVRDDDPVHAQVDEPGAGADHVGDRVEGADLVEVHLFGCVPVHPALGLGQPREHVVRERTDVLVQPGPVEQRLDVAPGAVLGGVDELDPAVGRREAAAAYLRDLEADLSRCDLVDRLDEHPDGYAGTDQRTEQHVATGSRGGIDPGEPFAGALSHGRPGGRCEPRVQRRRPRRSRCRC